jgi:hypothetical protein
MQAGVHYPGLHLFCMAGKLFLLANILSIMKCGFPALFVESECFVAVNYHPRIYFYDERRDLIGS